MNDDLRRWVEQEAGSAVTTVETIGRGASRRIWAVDLASGDALVVREETGTGPVAGTPLDLRREATVYAALRHTDLPVPALHAVSPDGRALLLDRATGVEDLKAVGDADRRAATADYGRCLARLHALDVDALDLGDLAVPADKAVHAELDLWQSIHESRSGDAATPGVSLAIDWLRGTVPAAAEGTALCHGDAGPGNFLHDGGRVTAMLDWEFAHVGDPHDDLAWVSVRNEVLRHPIDLATAYRAWGSPIDASRLEWFRVLVVVRMLISCDATIGWAGEEAPAARVQAVLRPWLAVALLEALRRAGCPPADVAGHDGPAQQQWQDSTIAGILGDPSDLDDLGAAL